jgi:hypothetical protein
MDAFASDSIDTIPRSGLSFFGHQSDTAASLYVSFGLRLANPVTYGNLERLASMIGYYFMDGESRT